MAGEYVLFSDLRPGSAAEFASGLELPDSVVGDDALITSAIARMSQRFDDLTNDHFSTQTSTTLTLQGYGGTILYLPRRCTAVTTVSVTNYAGTTTAQAATVYRLHSSLNSAGSAWNTPGDLDWLELLPYQYLSGASFGLGYAWPDESNSVTVLGTFGWTVTPTDVKRAVALMVYAEFQPQADVLGHVTQWSDSGTIYQRSVGPTGLPAVDELVERYKRTQSVMVG
jgi:hypothetical protein